MARRTLSANELRRLAEAVDGIRDRKAYVVWGADGPEVKTRVSATDDVMAECETTNVVRGRSRFDSISIDPPLVDRGGKRVSDVASRCDALFWSEPAVEKFVLPYYLRFRTPRQVDTIRDLFDQPSVYAIMHLPLSGCVFLASTRTEGRTIEALTQEELQAAL
jgi:hypothetical protein